MADEIMEALDDQILDELVHADNFDPESKEHQTIIDNVCKLFRVRSEQLKIDGDYDEQINRRELDEKKMKAELEKQERDDEYQKSQDRLNMLISIAKIGLVDIVLPIGFCMAYYSKVNKGFKFEQTGTYTSKTFMDHMKHDVFNFKK